MVAGVVVQVVVVSTLTPGVPTTFLVGVPYPYSDFFRFVGTFHIHACTLPLVSILTSKAMGTGRWGRGHRGGHGRGHGGGQGRGHGGGHGGGHGRGHGAEAIGEAMGRGRGAECMGEMGLARLLSLGTYALPTWATWHRLHEKRTQTRVVMVRWLPETTVA